MNYINQFNEQKFVYLPDFLDKTNCVELTSEFQKLHAEGKTEVDTQCSKSFSVYGAEIFDRLLEQLCPYFEEASGLKLYPTYSYARIYQPGETLKIHRDRDSCEISASLTLAIDDNYPWDIFFGFDGTEDDNEYSDYDEENNLKYIKNVSKLRMNVGDAVLYRGKEIYHWRKEYLGKKQVQVFLHYVDINGPCSNSKYDGRGQLTHHKDDESIFFWYYKDGLPLHSCNKIIESIELNSEFREAEIGSSATGIIDKSVRDVCKINLPSYRGIAATLTGMGLDANNKAWKFNVTHSEQTDYLKYNENGHYKEHIDTFFKLKDVECRKLTVLAFLNDDFEGGKLFLKIGHEKIYPPQSAGTVIVFPSFFLHGVDPVISGTRRTVVTWLLGPSFK